MSLQRMFSGDPKKSATLYLVIGVLSLAKAIAVRKDRDRFRRELLDAGLFIGVGLILRRFGQVKEEKREEINQRLPDWMTQQSQTSGSTGVRARAKRRFGNEPEPEPTVWERAQRAISGGS